MEHLPKCLGVANLLSLVIEQIQNENLRIEMVQGRENLDDVLVLINHLLEEVDLVLVHANYLHGWHRKLIEEK